VAKFDEWDLGNQADAKSSGEVNAAAGGCSGSELQAGYSREPSPSSLRTSNA
jgi:hypothetical protein